MHRSTVLAPVLLVLLTLSALVPGAAQAQDATPRSAGACTVAPRPVDEVVALFFGAGSAPLATPTPSPGYASLMDLPAGDPVDAETEAAINATIEQLFACFETRQFARAFALMTDDLVRRFGPDRTDSDEDTAAEIRAILEAQAETTPVPAFPVTGWALEQPRRLPDGRVGAIFTDVTPAALVAGFFTDLEFLLFEHQGGLWVLADIAEIEAAGTPALATPPSPIAGRNFRA